MTKYVVDWFTALTWALGRVKFLIKVMLAGLMVLTGWLLIETREPPIKDLPLSAPIQVNAGKWAELRLPVQRDLSRDCEVRYSRILLDADGTPFEIAGGQLPHDEIVERAKLSPNSLVIMLLIPPLRTATQAGIDTGPAWLITTRNFICNPLHVHWPIRQTVVTPLLILP